MSEIILISDGEDDIIPLSGPSRPRVSQTSRPKLTAPIFIDDSDDDETPTASVTDLIADIMADRKGKRKASFSEITTTSVVHASAPKTSTVITTTRSTLLDLLDDDTFQFGSPNSEADLDTPLAATPKKPAAKKKKVDSAAQQDKADKAAEAARKREEKEQTKKQEKEEKARQKEEAKLEKEIAKSRAAKEKDVNKVGHRRGGTDRQLRNSKVDTVRKVHVYMTADLFAPSSPIAAALPDIRTKLEDNMSKLLQLKEDECFLPNTIRFLRHVEARWDQSRKRYISLDQDRWEWESTVLIVVKAEEIVDLIMTHSDGLAEWASDARLTLGLQPSDQIFVIIKGLQKYYSKTKSDENRQFQAAARAGLGERDVVRPNRTVRADKSRIEAELVRLQVAEHCFIVHVEKTEDIENWIWNLSADIALQPYKAVQKSHLNFCPDNAPKSVDPGDVFHAMLQQISGITSSAASGIAREYTNFKDLMEAYEKAERRGAAELMLEDCEIRNLKDGTANGRRLNKALSQRVWRTFRREDGLELQK